MTRRLKSWVATAAVVMAASATLPSPAWAAGRHRGGSAQQTSATTQLETALAKINLSASQKFQISQILASAKSRRASSSSVTASSSTTAGAASATQKCNKSHKGGKKGLVDRVMAVLTPPQQTQLASLLHAGRSKGTGQA